MENTQQSFWQFSDQLRDQTNNNLANLSLNDSIWSNSYASKKSDRHNFDVRVGGEINSVNSSNTLQANNRPNFQNFDRFNSTNTLKAKEADFNHEFQKFDLGLEGNLNSVNSSNTLHVKNEPSFLNFDSVTAFKVKEADFNTGFRKFDIRVGGELNSVNSPNTLKANEPNFNGFNHNWKIGGSDLNNFNLDWKLNTNTGLYSNPSDYNLGYNKNLNNINLNLNKGYFKKSEDSHQFNQQHNNNYHGAKIGKKNKKKDNNKDSENKDNKNSVEKRFKTLPASEALPRNETIGGYIFVCNNDTMEENLKRQLFGLPHRYRDSVRSITPGLPLFLYNYSTHQLHGVYEAASFGGTNIDPSAWEDKKNPGESRFPAQVRVMTKKICEPLEEDSFRPILHHYDGPKFRLELNIPEVLALLDIFLEN